MKGNMYSQPDNRDDNPPLISMNSESSLDFNQFRKLTWTDNIFPHCQQAQEEPFRLFYSSTLLSHYEACDQVVWSTSNKAPVQPYIMHTQVFQCVLAVNLQDVTKKQTSVSLCNPS